MIKIHTAGSPRLVTAAQLQTLVSELSETQANALIDTASTKIANETRRTLYRQEVTETFRNVCKDQIRLDRTPIAEIVSVIVDGVAVLPADYEHDESCLYRLSNDQGMAWRGAKIAVRYRGAFDVIPLDIQRACLDLCVSLHNTQGRDLTVRSINIPDVETVSFREDSNGGGVIPTHVADIITQYRRVFL